MSSGDSRRRRRSSIRGRVRRGSIPRAGRRHATGAADAEAPDRSVFSRSLRDHFAQLAAAEAGGAAKPQHAEDAGGPGEALDESPSPGRGAQHPRLHARGRALRGLGSRPLARGALRRRVQAPGAGVEEEEKTPPPSPRVRGLDLSRLTGADRLPHAGASKSAGRRVRFEHAAAPGSALRGGQREYKGDGLGHTSMRDAARAVRTQRSVLGRMMPTSTASAEGRQADMRSLGLVSPDIPRAVGLSAPRGCEGSIINPDAILREVEEGMGSSRFTEDSIQNPFGDEAINRGIANSLLLSEHDRLNPCRPADIKRAWKKTREYFSEGFVDHFLEQGDGLIVGFNPTSMMVTVTINAQNLPILLAYAERNRTPTERRLKGSVFSCCGGSVLEDRRESFEEFLMCYYLDPLFKAEGIPYRDLILESIEQGIKPSDAYNIPEGFSLREEYARNIRILIEGPIVHADGSEIDLSEIEVANLVIKGSFQNVSFKGARIGRLTVEAMLDHVSFENCQIGIGAFYGSPNREELSHTNLNNIRTDIALAFFDITTTGFNPKMHPGGYFIIFGLSNIDPARGRDVSVEDVARREGLFVSQSYATYNPDYDEEVEDKYDEATRDRYRLIVRRGRVERGPESVVSRTLSSIKCIEEIDTIDGNNPVIGAIFRAYAARAFEHPEAHLSRLVVDAGLPDLDEVSSEAREESASTPEFTPPPRLSARAASPVRRGVRPGSAPLPQPSARFFESSSTSSSSEEKDARPESAPLPQSSARAESAGSGMPSPAGALRRQSSRSEGSEEGGRYIGSGFYATSPGSGSATGFTSSLDTDDGKSRYFAALCGRDIRIFSHIEDERVPVISVRNRRILLLYATLRTIDNNPAKKSQFLAANQGITNIDIKFSRRPFREFVTYIILSKAVFNKEAELLGSYGISFNPEKGLRKKSYDSMVVLTELTSLGYGSSSSERLDLVGANFEHCSFKGMIIDGDNVELGSTNFSGANLDEVKFANIDLSTLIIDEKTIIAHKISDTEAEENKITGAPIVADTSSKKPTWGERARNDNIQDFLILVRGDRFIRVNLMSNRYRVSKSRDRGVTVASHAAGAVAGVASLAVYSFGTAAILASAVDFGTRYFLRNQLIYEDRSEVPSELGRFLANCDVYQRGQMRSMYHLINDAISTVFSGHPRKPPKFMSWEEILEHVAREVKNGNYHPKLPVQESLAQEREGEKIIASMAASLVAAPLLLSRNASWVGTVAYGLITYLGARGVISVARHSTKRLEGTYDTRGEFGDFLRHIGIVWGEVFALDFARGLVSVLVSNNLIKDRSLRAAFSADGALRVASAADGAFQAGQKLRSRPKQNEQKLLAEISPFERNRIRYIAAYTTVFTGLTAGLGLWAASATFNFSVTLASFVWSCMLAVGPSLALSWWQHRNISNFISPAIRVMNDLKSRLAFTFSRESRDEYVRRIAGDLYAAQKRIMLDQLNGTIKYMHEMAAENGVNAVPPNFSHLIKQFGRVFKVSELQGSEKARVIRLFNQIINPRSRGYSEASSRLTQSMARSSARMAPGESEVSLRGLAAQGRSLLTRGAYNAATATPGVVRVLLERFGRSVLPTAASDWMFGNNASEDAARPTVPLERVVVDGGDSPPGEGASRQHEDDHIQEQIRRGAMTISAIIGRSDRSGSASEREVGVAFGAAGGAEGSQGQTRCASSLPGTSGGGDDDLAVPVVGAMPVVGAGRAYPRSFGASSSASAGAVSRASDRRALHPGGARTSVTAAVSSDSSGSTVSDMDQYVTPMPTPRGLSGDDGAGSPREGSHVASEEARRSARSHVTGARSHSSGSDSSGDSVGGRVGCSII